MPQQKNFEDFYNRLSEHITIDATVEGFSDAMRDPQRRRRFFDQTTQHVDMGEWNDFNSRMDEFVKQDLGIDPNIGRFSSGFGQFAQSFASVVAGVPESIAILAKKMNQLTGEVLEEDKPLSEFVTFQLGQDIRQVAQDTFPTNPKFQEEFITSTLAGGAGSVAGFVTGGLTGKGLRLGIGTVSALLGATSLGSEEYRRALEKTGDEDKAFDAFLVSLPIGATEAIPIAKAFKRIDQVTGNSVKRVLAKSFSGGLEEMTQEVMQNFMTNAAAQQIYDVERKLSEGVAEGGAAGFILGTALNAMGLSAKRLGNRVSTSGRIPTQEEARKATREEDEVKPPTPITQQEAVESPPITKLKGKARKQFIQWAKTQVDESYWLKQLDDPKGLSTIHEGEETNKTSVGANPEVLTQDNINEAGDITFKKRDRVWAITKKLQFPLFILHRMRKKSATPDVPSIPEKISFDLISAQLAAQHKEKDYQAWYQKLRPTTLFGIQTKARKAIENKARQAMELIYEIRSDRSSESGRIGAKTKLAELYKEFPVLQKMIDGVDGKGGLIHLFEHVKGRVKESKKQEFEEQMKAKPGLFEAWKQVIETKGEKIKEAVEQHVDVTGLAKAAFIKAKSKKQAGKKALTKDQALRLWKKGGTKIEKFTKGFQARLIKNFKTKFVDSFLDIDNWGLNDYISNIELGNYEIIDPRTGNRLAFAKTVREAHQKARKLRIEMLNAGESVGPLLTQATISRINPTAKRKDVLKGEENIFEVLPRYIHAMEKRIQMRPILARIKRLRKETPEVFTSDVNGILQSQIDEIMGNKYSFVERIFDDISEARGWELGKARKYAATIGKIEAFNKLGYRPIAGIVNALSGFGNTYVKVGNDIWLRARKVLKSGQYVAPDGTIIDLHKRLAEIEENGKLGLDFAVSDTGEIQSRLPIWHPLGIFQRPESPIRNHGFVANYILQRERYGLNDVDATWQALENMWFQQATYNSAAVPDILRSPTGKVVGQFKSYFINHLQFLSTLRSWEIPRYIAVMMTLAGPRGAVYFLKSLPIFFVLGLDDDLGKLENWLVSGDDPIAKSSRGVFGAVGGDISAPATFQFPNQADQWLGPFVSDAIKFYKDLFVPGVQSIVNDIAGGDKTEAPQFITQRGVDWVKGISPLLYYWNQLMESLVVAWDKTDKGDPDYKRMVDVWQQPNIWIRDSKGNKAWLIGGFQDRLLLATGAMPIALSDYNIKKRVLRTTMEIRKDNRRVLLNRLSKKLLNRESLNKDDRHDMILYGLSPKSLPSSLRWKEMTPELRETLKQQMLDRPEAMDVFGL